MGCVVPARGTRVGSASGRGTSLRRVGSWCLGRRAFRAHRASRFPRLAAATKDRRTRGPAKPCWGLGLPRWRPLVAEPFGPVLRIERSPGLALCVVVGAVGLLKDAGSAHRQGGWHVFVAQGQAAYVTHGRGQRWGRGWQPCVLDSIPRPGLFRGTARRPL